ncbi:hypothetical protein ABMA28_000447 [Loxostege sticticalis]|uniref:Peptidase S1 domain-containing protein n=1 Tax=Loxostege sticticalis TaxID=481309 RepID=A0ABD0TSE3_LOXSC
MNKIFTSLKLKKSFKESTKIRLLLTMHKNLINVSKKSYEKSAIENNFDNITIKEFPEPDNIIDEILEEEYLIPFFPLDEMNQYDFDFENTLDESLSELLSGHLIQFLLKIDEVTSQLPQTNDGTSNNNILKKNFNNNALYRRSGTRYIPRDLKDWVPDAYHKFAFNRRIFRGKTTKIKKYPFMASVHVSGSFSCAGSIISKELVITAATCLQIPYLYRNRADHKNNVTVRIGSDFTTHGGQLLNISDIFFHPQYNPENLKHNLAILRMSKDKPFPKKKKIRKVLFDKTPDDLPSDVKQVTIVGWGAKDEKNQQDPSTKLSLAHLDLYKLEECKAVYSKYYVTESTFCAGITRKGSGACEKDVGDPAVVAGVLVGVVSFGPPLCGTVDAPTVFTRINIYAGWIDTILKMDPTATATTEANFRIPVLNQSVSHSRKPTQLNPENPELNLNSANKLGPIRLDDPEDIFVLKAILTEIASSNNSDIKDVIDKGFEEEFWDFFETTTKRDLKQKWMTLANRSLNGIPGANFPQEIYDAKQQSKIEQPMVATTIGRALPENYLENQKLGEMVEEIKYQKIAKITSATKKWIRREKSTTRSYNKNRPRKITKPLFSDTDDAASGNYEVAGSEEEMSLEVNKMTPIGKTTKTKLLLVFRDYNTVKKTTKLVGETADYNNIFFIKENMAEIVEYTKKNLKTNKPNTYGRTKAIYYYIDEDDKSESTDSHNVSGSDDYYINRFSDGRLFP